MVASNHDLVLVGQGAEPVIQILYVIQSASTEAITGVDQYVAVRNPLNPVVQRMSVGYTNDFHSSNPSSQNKFSTLSKLWPFPSFSSRDVSEFIAQSGVQTNLSRCTSYERAVFGLLYHHIEQKNRTLANVQPSGIDSVVAFDRVRDWVQKWEMAGKLIRKPAMRT
tara:strand:- start:580 stop:1077 length:498 start_codon:yes stop_codon:yes gene_type:complete